MVKITKNEYLEFNDAKRIEYLRDVLNSDLIEAVFPEYVYKKENHGYAIGWACQIMPDPDKNGKKHGYIKFINILSTQIYIFSDADEKYHTIFDNQVEGGDYVLISYRLNKKNDEVMFIEISTKLDDKQKEIIRDFIEQHDIDTVNSFKEELEEECSRLKNEATELKTVIDERNEQLDKSIEEEKNLTEKNEVLNENIEKAQKKCDDIKEEVKRLNAEKEILKELGVSFEGKANSSDDRISSGNIDMRTYPEYVSKIREMAGAGTGAKLAHYGSMGPRIVDRFLSAMFTNQIIILSGPSGTGKTTLSQVVAGALGGECVVIPVQPNWTDHQDLFGYYNFMDSSYVSTEFLDVIIRAGRNPDKLYFAVLDEMNLAHIEYYLADYLSAMEREEGNRWIALYSDKSDALIDKLKLIVQSDKELLEKLNSGECVDRDGNLSEEYISEIHDSLSENESYKDWKDQYEKWERKKRDVPCKVRIPNNLQIVGTVNMDETTKGISPKIIDRSYVIEIGNDKDIKLFESNEQNEGSNDFKIGEYISDNNKDESADSNPLETVSDIIVNFMERLNYNKQISAKMSARQRDQIERIFNNVELDESIANKFADDIILSKILPSLRNRGIRCSKEDHNNMMEKIDEEIRKAIPESIKKLDDMYSDMETYDYWEK